MSATRAPNGGAPGIRHETDGDGRTAAIRPERTAVPVLRPLSGLRELTADHDVVLPQGIQCRVGKIRNPASSHTRLTFPGIGSDSLNL